MTGGADGRAGCLRRAGDADFGDVVLGATGPVLACFHAGAGAGPDGTGELLAGIARALPWLAVVAVGADRAPRTLIAYRVGPLPTAMVFERGLPVLTLSPPAAPPTSEPVQTPTARRQSESQAV